MGQRAVPAHADEREQLRPRARPSSHCASGPYPPTPKQPGRGSLPIPFTCYQVAHEGISAPGSRVLMCSPPLTQASQACAKLIREMLDVLLRPTDFFRALAGRRPDLVAPFFIVMAGAVMASLGQALLTRLLPSPIPGGAAAQVVLALVGGIVGGLLAWGLGGLVLRLLAGPDSRAWEVYGWASMPGLLMGLLTHAHCGLVSHHQQPASRTSPYRHGGFSGLAARLSTADLAGRPV
jgi:hypothetical protein